MLALNAAEVPPLHRIFESVTLKTGSYVDHWRSMVAGLVAGLYPVYLGVRRQQQSSDDYQT